MAEGPDATRILLCPDFLPEEKEFAVKMDYPISAVFCEHGIIDHFVWENGNEEGHRVVQLRTLLEPRQVLLKLPAEKISTISEDEVVSLLTQSIKQCSLFPSSSSPS